MMLAKIDESKMKRSEGSEERVGRIPVPTNAAAAERGGHRRCEPKSSVDAAEPTEEPHD